MSLLERLEGFERNKDIPKWYKDVYLIDRNEYIKSPVVQQDGIEAVKAYGNLYYTRYDKDRRAYVVSCRFGKVRY